MTTEASEAGPPRKQRPKKRSGWARAAALAVVVTGIAMIASTVRGTAFVYSKWVHEVMRPGEQQRWVGRTVRLEGLVAPGSVEHREGSRDIRFRVYSERDGQRAMVSVQYQGIVPSTFRDCAGVTVRGQLQASGTFVADEIMAKCPSKYEAATVVNGQCVVGVSPRAGNPPERR